jgi:hypothetical protein
MEESDGKIFTNKLSISRVQEAKAKLELSATFYDNTILNRSSGNVRPLLTSAY